MRTPALVLSVVAVILLLSPAGAQEKANPPDKGGAEESARKVREFQKERVDILKRAADSSFKMVKNVRLEVGDLLQTRMSLLQAELELTEKESDRVALYKGALDSLKEYEEFARAMFESGRGAELSVLKVKAKQLEIKIILEQANLKGHQKKPTASEK